jgi:hypothetical protein
MLKKIIIGVLVITVIGAAGAALAYNAFNQEAVQASTNPSPLANGQNANISDQVALGQTDVAVQDGPLAEGLEGQPWKGVGNIKEVDEYGFDFTTNDGESVYIELGPPDYWQAQDLELSEGQLVMVSGSINDGIVHAISVTFSDGQELTLRTETGQPMWSGGVSQNRGQNAGSGDGDHTPDPQASVDEWITLEGTLMSFQGGNMTLSTADGTLISFQTGQPRFFAGQGVTFQVGDAIRLLGFYEGEQFMAGEITQTSTGLRVMLRDPNGRPLWAGPGSYGNGGNSRNAGNGKGGNNRGNDGPQG